MSFPRIHTYTSGTWRGQHQVFSAPTPGNPDGTPLTRPTWDRAEAEKLARVALYAPALLP